MAKKQQLGAEWCSAPLHLEFCHRSIPETCVHLILRATPGITAASMPSIPWASHPAPAHLAFWRWRPNMLALWRDYFYFLIIIKQQLSRVAILCWMKPQVVYKFLGLLSMEHVSMAASVSHEAVICLRLPHLAALPQKNALLKSKRPSSWSLKFRSPCKLLQNTNFGTPPGF